MCLQNNVISTGSEGRPPIKRKRLSLDSQPRHHSQAGIPAALLPQQSGPHPHLQSSPQFQNGFRMTAECGRSFVSALPRGAIAVTGPAEHASQTQSGVPTGHGIQYISSAEVAGTQVLGGVSPNAVQPIVQSTRAMSLSGELCDRQRGNGRTTRASPAGQLHGREQWRRDMVGRVVQGVVESCGDGELVIVLQSGGCNYKGECYAIL